MSVPTFLVLIFGCLTAFGLALARVGYWKLYWVLMVGIIAIFAISVAVIWRPSTDDPIPALMFLVIGVYGSLAGGAGMLTGLVVSKAMKSRRDNV